MQNKNNKTGVTQVTEFHEETVKHKSTTTSKQINKKKKKSGWTNECTDCNLDSINALRPARSPVKYSS